MSARAGPSWRGDAACLAVLCALVSLPTLKTVLTGPALCAAGPTDAVAQILPMTRWFHDTVRAEGPVPLWRTSQLYGHGTIDDPPHRVLYPPFYVYAALDMPLAQHVYWLLHALLLAGGTYALARGERSTRRAALLAGVAIGLSFKSYAYLMAGWDTIHGSLAWIPHVLFAFRRACARASPRAAALMAVCLAGSCLAGTPQFPVVLGIALPVAALAVEPRRRARVVAVLAFGFGAGFALAAPVLLGSVGAGARSARSILGTGYGTTLGADVIGAVAFPFFSREDYSWETAGGLGFALLPLAGAGVARRPFSLWTCVLVLMLTLAGGDSTPVGLAFGKLPLVGSLSYPSRLVWIAMLALLVLAARGLDALERLGSLRSRKARRLLVGLACGTAALVVGALWPGRAGRVRPEGFSHGAAVLGLGLEVALGASLLLLPLIARAKRRFVLAALVAATAAELLLLAELALVRVPWSELTRRGEIEARLEREPLARIASVTSQSVWFDPVVPYYALPGVERADGYNPLHEKDTSRFLYSIAPDRINRPGQGFGHMYGLWAPYVGLQGTERPGLLALGVTHVVSHEPLPGFEVVVTETRRFLSPSGEWSERPVCLQRVPSALPRAFVMTRALAEAGATQRSVMRRGRFDGRRTLFLDAAVAPELQGECDALPAEVVEHREGRVTVRATAPAEGGWVVLLDAYSPGWSATVDGAPATIERADAIFRAVRIGAGEHTVVMKAGLPTEALAGCGVAVAGLVTLVLALSRRPSSRGPSPSGGGASASAAPSAPTP